LDEQEVAVVRRRMAADELTSWLSGVYGTMTVHLQRIGVATVGPPFVRYHDRGDHLDVEAGLPTAERVTPKDEVASTQLPGGTAAVAWHRGSPDGLDEALEALDAWVEQQGVEPVEAPWVVLHVDPTTPPDGDGWEFELIQPFRD
jgi:effector-binding domain-containing protein